MTDRGTLICVVRELGNLQKQLSLLRQLRSLATKACDHQRDKTNLTATLFSFPDLDVNDRFICLVLSGHTLSLLLRIVE